MKIISLVLAIFPLIACPQQHFKTNAERDHLKGKVKSVTTIAYMQPEKNKPLVKTAGMVPVDVYDEQGKKMKTTYYDRNGVLVGIFTPRYYDNGNIIEEDAVDSFGNAIGKNVYKYDEKGRLIEKCTSLKPIWDSLIRKYSYNERKHTQQVGTYHEGKLVATAIMKINEAGCQISRQDYTAEGIEYLNCTFQYEFDQTGNWVKQTTYIKRRAVGICKREIEYY